MREILSSPSRKPPRLVNFQKPFTAQKHGIEILRALNESKRTVLTGPDVGILLSILVTKAGPNFFFNPSILNSTTEEDDNTIKISYCNYLGTEKGIVLNDEDASIRKAIDYLHNGTTIKNKEE